MAYVRRTKKLIDGIKRKIAHMAAKAKAMHTFHDVEYGSSMYQEVAKAVETQAWHLHPALYDKMPDAWCYFTNHVNVRFLNFEGSRIKSLTLNTPDTNKIKLPCKPSNYYDDVYVEYEHQSVALRQWLADESKRQAEVKATRDQYREVERQILAFMSTKTSLNAALKEMPELEMYVPDEFMRKFHEPTEPRAKKLDEEREEVFVDRDTLAALGVAHRIATAAE